MLYGNVFNRGAFGQKNPNIRNANDEVAHTTQVYAEVTK